MLSACCDRLRWTKNPWPLSTKELVPDSCVPADLGLYR